MRLHSLSGAVFVLAIGQSVSTYAVAACGDVTVCNYYKTPPCTITHNVCSIAPPDAAMVAPEEQSYSVELKNLSKSQLQKVLKQIGPDKSKVAIPQ